MVEEKKPRKKITNYQKGKGREQYIKTLLKEKEGYDIVLRMAGSKGFCDLVAIKKKTREVLFVQVKPKKHSKLATQRLFDENSWIKGKFDGDFDVR